LNSEKIWKIQRTWSTTQHIRKQPKKRQETPTSDCAWAHPSTPSGSRDLWSLPVAMVLVLLYYYHSKKKARETEKKKWEKMYGKKKNMWKKYGKKSTGKKVREKKKSTGKKYGKKSTRKKKSTGKKKYGENWVIKCTLRNTTQWRGVLHNISEKRAGNPNFRSKGNPVGYPWGDLRSLPVALSVMRNGHFRLGACR